MCSEMGRCSETKVLAKMLKTAFSLSRPLSSKYPLSLVQTYHTQRGGGVCKNENYDKKNCLFIVFDSIEYHINQNVEYQDTYCWC